MLLNMQVTSLILFSIAKLGGQSKLYKEILKRRLHTADKLNIGCGENFVENWVNIGLIDLPKGLYFLSKTKNSAPYVHFDITQEFPIRPNTIQFIYASHFIEHLNFPQALIFLKNCYTVTRSDGVIRLTFPDLELWNKKYMEDDLGFFTKYYDYTKHSNKLPELRTKGEIFMSQVHGWDHKWCYDFDSIKDILERAGYSEVVRKKAFDSSLPDIEKLEPDNQQRLLETIYVEAKKSVNISD